AGIGIGLAHLIVILGPILPHFRGVGMICRDAHSRWIMNGLVRTGANLALVAFERIEDGEERLTGSTVPPLTGLRGVVPDLSRLGQVVVLLGVVAAVVARFAQELREHLLPRRLR